MDKLPDEILCQILRNLKASEIAKLAPTCTIFARVAESSLYAHCQLSSEDPSHQLRTLQRILRTLIGCPDLGRLVREIDLSEWYFGNPSPDGPSYKDKLALLSPRTRHEFIRCSPMLNSCSTEFQSDFWSGLRDSTQDALTAAILFLLPNLRSLSLEMDCYEWDEENGSFSPTERDPEGLLTFRLIELAAMSQPMDRSLFRHLSSASLFNLNLFWDIRTLSFFLRLRTIRILKGWGCEDLHNDRTWACDDAASNVTHLELHGCEIGAVSIRNILRSCQALETFICHRYRTSDEDGDMPEDYLMFWADVHHDLLRHRESLRHLHLDSISLVQRELTGHEPTRFASLAAFEALEELEVEESALYGCNDYSTRHLSQFLPPNIERLAIVGGAEFYLNELLRELRDVLLSNLNLRTIEVKSADISRCDQEFLRGLPGLGIETITSRNGSHMQRPETLTMSRIDDEEDDEEIR